MNTPLSWVKAYVPELECTEKEYMDAMTLSGTKVEGYEKFDADLDKIIVGRIEKIENERVEPHPEEILIMAQKYKSPELCNYYCSNQCPIGQQYVPEVKIQDLSQIVLKMVDSLNTVQDNQRRLISITADGIVDDSEIDDFVSIQEELEKISITVEALQLWTEQMVANGAIDMDKYEARRKRK